MTDARPTVTGTLGKTPLLHVLISLLERGSTGTLVIETTASVRSALYVEHGVPSKMRLGTPEARLGDVLVQLGYLKGAVAEATYAKAAEGHQLHGRILTAEGLLDERTLTLALRAQLIQKLLVSAALPETTVFGLYEGTDYLAKWRSGITRVSPLAAAWALAQSRADPKTVASVTSRIADHPLRLHRKALLSAFGFEREELALLDVLRARPQNLESLRRMGLVSPDHLDRLVYVLTLTRHLDFGRDLTPLGLGSVAEEDEAVLDDRESLRPSRPVMLGVPTDATPMSPQLSSKSSHDIPSSKTSKDTASGAVASKPTTAHLTTPLPGAAAANRAPEAPSAQSEERLAKFQQMADTLDDRDYFELLGVERDATAATIQETFLKLAKLYHPDRLSEDGNNLRPLATKIFARLSEAVQTLTEPGKRQAYLERLRKGTTTDDEDEKVRRALRAAGSFHRAEVLLKKRMMAAAELEANRALDDDPDQPDHIALCAWIQACKPDSDARLPELIKRISDAISRNGDSEKNRFYRVQLLKRMGRLEEAVADCRAIVDRNPHHTDALREIRLWGMRKPPPKATGQRTLEPPKGSPGKHRSDLPNQASSPKHGSRPPPPSAGGFLGRLFKR